MTKATVQKLVNACEAVEKWAGDTVNCGICAGDPHGGHEEGCPVPAVQQALEAAKERKAMNTKKSNKKGKK
jgi:hypothetical protein